MDPDPEEEMASNLVLWVTTIYLAKQRVKVSLIPALRGRSSKAL
jgi:hypothetical protein